MTWTLSHRRFCHISRNRLRVQVFLCSYHHATFSPFLTVTCAHCRSEAYAPTVRVTFKFSLLKPCRHGKTRWERDSQKTNSGVVAAAPPTLTIEVYGSRDISVSRVWRARFKHESTFGGQSPPSADMGLRAGGTEKRDENAIPRKPIRA